MLSMYFYFLTPIHFSICYFCSFMFIHLNTFSHRFTCKFFCIFTGDNAAYGSAYDFFGGGEEGRVACQAICALANIGQIDATITNFLIPLQVLLQYSIWTYIKHYFYLMIHLFYRTN